MHVVLLNINVEINAIFFPRFFLMNRMFKSQVKTAFI